MDNHERKDYMGLISWNRVECGAPIPMFGSEIKTDSPVCIRICKAYISEYSTPTNFRVSGEHPSYIEIEMTPIQWAEFLTAGHVDDGVPCTITRIDGKRTSPVEMRNIAAEYNVHVQEKFDNFQGGIKDLEKTVQEALDSGKPMSKTQMKELLRAMQFVRSRTVGDIEYAYERFKEDMANVVVKSKAEVNAYAELRLRGLGVKCLMNDAADEPPALEDKNV